MRELKFIAENGGRAWNVETRKAKRSNHLGIYRTQGYIKRLVTEHPFSDKRGYVNEHRLVMEEKLGRFLNEGEFVHHADQNRSNNDISNLELHTGASHAKEHLAGRGTRNPNGRLISVDPMFDEMKFRLLDVDTGLTRIFTLGKLIGTTFRRGKFEFRGRYTGLKDKNGKEIYEGDIIRYQPIPVIEKYETYQVVWDRWGFAFKEEASSDHSIVYLRPESVAVVDNVYESPEYASKKT